MNWILSVVAVLAFQGKTGEQSLSKVKELERKILKAQNAIVRGRGRLTIRQDMRQPDPKRPGMTLRAARTRKVSFAFDVSKFRIEEDGQITIKTKDEFLQYDTKRIGKGAPLMLDRTGKRRQGAFDPRLIWCGTGEIGALFMHDFSTHFLRTDLVRASAARVKMGKSKLWRIETENKRRQVRRRWVDPARQYGTVRYEIISKRHGKQFRTDTAFELKKFGEHWFPHMITITRHFDGRLIETIEVDVKDLTLNKPVDRELFEISSMGVPTGTHIQEEPRPRFARMWDGERIVPLNKSALPANEGEQTSAPDRNPYLIAVSVITAGLAGVCVVFYWRKRQRPEIETTSEPSGTG